jgi:hypothetical protein
LVTSLQCCEPTAATGLQSGGSFNKQTDSSDLQPQQVTISIVLNATKQHPSSIKNSGCFRHGLIKRNAWHCAEDEMAGWHATELACNSFSLLHHSEGSAIFGL